ncbi:hypothetical protein MTBSS4_440013 [Magnetospirillum sp. SS-4]|nr:hypothetical protein MTBSS4_440013 [Magnetospirillum sp. SS-4]
MLNLEDHQILHGGSGFTNGLKEEPICGSIPSGSGLRHHESLAGHHLDLPGLSCAFELHHDHAVPAALGGGSSQTTSTGSARSNGSALCRDTGFGAQHKPFAHAICNEGGFSDGNGLAHHPGQLRDLTGTLQLEGNGPLSSGSASGVQE